LTVEVAADHERTSVDLACEVGQRLGDVLRRNHALVHLDACRHQPLRPADPSPGVVAADVVPCCRDGSRAERHGLVLVGGRDCQPLMDGGGQHRTELDGPGAVQAAVADDDGMIAHGELSLSRPLTP
jgi:hypothetical protein